MASSPFLSAPTHSVLDRRTERAAKNRLLNLAFEDRNPTQPSGTDNPEEPKSVPADVFKQGCVHASFGSCKE